MKDRPDIDDMRARIERQVVRMAEAGFCNQKEIARELRVSRNVVSKILGKHHLRSRRAGAFS